MDVVSPVRRTKALLKVQKNPCFKITSLPGTYPPELFHVILHLVAQWKCYERIQGMSRTCKDHFEFVLGISVLISVSSELDFLVSGIFDRSENQLSL